MARSCLSGPDKAFREGRLISSYSDGNKIEAVHSEPTGQPDVVYLCYTTFVPRGGSFAAAFEQPENSPDWAGNCSEVCYAKEVTNHTFEVAQIVHGSLSGVKSPNLMSVLPLFQFGMMFNVPRVTPNGTAYPPAFVYPPAWMEQYRGAVHAAGSGLSCRNYDGEKTDCRASRYSSALNWKPTKLHEPYLPWLFTAASLNFPLGSLVAVEHANHRFVIVRINDCGPYGYYQPERILDLSHAALTIITREPIEEDGEKGMLTGFKAHLIRPGNSTLTCPSLEEYFNSQASTGN